MKIAVYADVNVFSEDAARRRFVKSISNPNSKYIGVAASLLAKLDEPEALDEKIARGKVLFDARFGSET